MKDLLMHFKNKQKLIIAIDGQSSCGKSTVAKDLAKLLQIIYVDSGAMYRSVTLYALRNKLLQEGNISEIELEKEMNHIDISFRFDPENKINTTFLNGENVEDQIRGIEVSKNVSLISAIPFVRFHLVKLQKEIGSKGGVVMDGRDIGTTVFPDAHLKIFMTASPEVRAKRRYDELKEKGVEVSFDDILINVIERDQIDSTREVSPLRKAEDAIELDNSSMSKEEQLDWILDKLKSKQLI